MGYVIFQREAEFSIKSKHFPAVINAIKSLKGKEPITDRSGSHFSFVRTEDFINSEDIEEIFYAWRWEIAISGGGDISDGGDIEDINFIGEKHGDDDLFFAVIAKFVEPESYIEMIGEDGKTWKWYFDGKFVYKVMGTIIFDAPTAENRLVVDELDGWIKFRS